MGLKSAEWLPKQDMMYLFQLLILLTLFAADWVAVMLLPYPFAMYFFIAKDNQALWQRLNAGLEYMVSRGDLIRCLQKHPAATDIFPLSRLRGCRVLQRSKPLLSPQTPLRRTELWLMLRS